MRYIGKKAIARVGDRVKKINLKLRELGFDSIKYKNIIEGDEEVTVNYSYIIFEPKNARSVSAKFEDLESADLLKASGGLIEKVFGRTKPSMMNKFNNFINASNKQNALAEFKSAV